VVETRPSKTLSDEDIRLGIGIDRVGETSLSQRARAGMNVVIAFTDATRSCPDHLLVSLLLDELEQAGVTRDHITLLCATGLHRPMTHDELVAKLGEETVASVRIESHNALDSEQLVDL